ncbi:MAG: hypothetical protein K2O32_03295, partial [Acetatifactor sp.]|nr:hypothetical protein [Acetatifactor sp.]
MFEQTISTMLRRRLGRTISIVMSVAMLVTALPADLLGGILSVKAATDAGTATVLNVSGMTKGKVAAGAMNGSVFSAKDDSMSVVEDTQTFDGEDYTQSLKMTADSVITFDAAKGNTLKIYAMTDDAQEGTDNAGSSTAATKLTVTGEEKGTAAEKARDTKDVVLTKALAVETMKLAVDGSYTLTVDGAAKVFYLELSSAQQPGGSITNTYVFDVSKDVTPPVGDKTEIPNGTKLGTNGYFKVITKNVTPEGESTEVKGKAVYRTANSGAKIKSIEFEKSESTSFQFEVKGSANAEFVVSSTGGSNASSVALVNVNTGKYVKPSVTSKITTGTDQSRKEADGTTVIKVEANGVQADNSVLVFGNETKPSTLIFEELEAGTYTIVSPYHKILNRGAWLISAKVEDTVQAQVVTKDYSFDVSKDVTPPVDDKTAIPNGTKLGTNGYFKVITKNVTPEGESTEVKGKAVYRTANSGAKIKSIEFEKSESTSFQFEVKGSANAEFVVSSTGGSNASSVALVNVNTGKYVKPSVTSKITTGTDQSRKEADGTTVIKVEANGVQADNSVLVFGNETKPSTLIFEELEAGTYTIVSPYHKILNRGAWLISAKVSDTFVDTGEDPILDWKDVADPEIVSAKVSGTDKGTIEVQAKGQVGNGGADSMKVVMFDKDNKEVDSKQTLVDGDVHTLEFQPAASGSYTFVAHLVREDEEDKVSASSAAVAFVLPMATPVIQGVSNQGADANGKGGLTIVWDAVPEAEKYKVTIVDAKDTTNKVLASGETEETTITLGGLEVGTEVTVSVVAMRGTDVSATPGTINAVVKATGGTVYEIGLTNGLKAGQLYANGMLWVMADMPATSKDGKVYVKGDVNPKKINKADGKESNPSGAVPDKGTVVVVKTPETYEGNKVVRLTISSKTGSDKTFYLVSKDAKERVNVVASYNGGSDPIGKKFILDANKEYYFYADGSNQEIHQLKLEYQEIVRGPWGDVENPVIEKTPVIAGDNNEKIVVKATGVISDLGADSMYVEMFDERGDLIATKTTTNESDGTEPLSFEFVPTTSGKFSFRAALAREGEVTKYSERTDAIDFQYPLATPEFAAVTNKGLDSKGNAKLEVIWLKVNEA